MTTLLLVAVGAAIGAPSRYLIDRAVQARHDSVFPWGTLAVNVIGSAVLGFLAGLPAHPEVMAAAGSGFCGALTTYSTFSYEALRLAQDGARWHALVNIAANVIAGLGSGYLGLTAAQAVTGYLLGRFAVQLGNVIALVLLATLVTVGVWRWRRRKAQRTG